jgi:hypothetical protein
LTVLAPPVSTGEKRIVIPGLAFNPETFETFLTLRLGSRHGDPRSYGPYRLPTRIWKAIKLL